MVHTDLSATMASSSTTTTNSSDSTVIESLTWYRDLLIGYGSMFLAPLLPQLNPTPKPVSLKGKKAIVTGANSGVGLQLTIDLARLGATVYLACRSTKRGQRAVEHVASIVPEAKDENRIHLLQLDTSSLESVRKFASTWSQLGREEGEAEGQARIDVLFHNAGIGRPAASEKNFSPEGFDMIYATNVLGPFLLTNLLESYLSPDARVLFTSSVGSLLASFSDDFELPGPVMKQCEPGFHCPSTIKFLTILGGGELVRDDHASRYSHSKAMLVILATLLQERFDSKPTEGQMQGNGEGLDTGQRQRAYAFSPGFTQSKFLDKIDDESLNWRRDSIYLSAKAAMRIGLITDVRQGAATGIYLASTTDEEVTGAGAGGYYERMTRRMNWGEVMSEEKLQRIWKRWEGDAGIQWQL